VADVMLSAKYVAVVIEAMCTALSAELLQERKRGNEQQNATSKAILVDPSMLKDNTVIERDNVSWKLK